MSDAVVLKAEARDRVGKGSSRAIRRQGKIPAVIYGDNKDPISIVLPAKEVTLMLHQGGFLTKLLDIEVDGKKHKVLPKDYQLDPVKDFMMHVDFLRISSKTIVTVNIPVHIEGEDKCPGLTAGGVLNIVRHEVEVNCPASSIPEFFTIDISKSVIGDTLNISDVALPEGATPTITDRDFTIVTIQAPGGGAAEEETDAPEASEVPATAQSEEGGEA
ncbi:50S ribosomal protein L25/general stress protein Ctc [Ahrensia kielensis]|uniref:Large ribosomal subunit protein bL25 n=1 Tax=Ahrensia kielensis TaxID=76980 RepID=A0ABU9T768_9HYPH|nr:50S ribosomal protein L25/general stress protein Ctc [Ahrensia kielensis]